MRISRSVAVAMSALALGLGACATDSGTARRDPVQFSDDASLTVRVKTAIAADANLGTASAVNVNTYRGVVQLSGFVDTYDKIDKAGAIARNVPGVQRVENNVQLKPRS